MLDSTTSAPVPVPAPAPGRVWAKGGGGGKEKHLNLNLNLDLNLEIPSPWLSRPLSPSLQHHHRNHHNHRNLPFDTFNSPSLSSENIIATTFFCVATATAADTKNTNSTSPGLHHHAPYCLSYIPEHHLQHATTVDLQNLDNPLCYDLDSINSGASTPYDGTDTSSIASPRSSLRRSLTHPLAIPTEDAMNFVDDAHPMPDSPPDLSGSKSSKSSSFHSSYQSDENSILVDVAHFEEIGLDDDARSEREIGDFDMKSPNPFTATYDLRSKRPRSRTSQSAIMQRELTNTKIRPAFPSLKGQLKNVTDTQGLGLMPVPAMSRRGFTSPSTPTLALAGKRHRSLSPNNTISSHSLPNAQYMSSHPRRGSWQANRERKSQKELEKECDDDDGDDVPDDFVLENVPISPRPPQERRQSLPPSPDRTEKKEKIRPAGNGTPLIPVEQGSLRSPVSPVKPAIGHRGISMGQFPINHDVFPLKGRAKSWNAALSDLSEEAKSLTEALEAHADEQVHTPRSRSSSRSVETERKHRVHSSLAELPPLRRPNIMIDPLPISKEKEAVLSRTRPSWLPPKNPAEEKKHLKEYQRMMASSLAMERKRESDDKARKECRDDTASSLLRIWEEHVIPNWDHVVCMKRTRELWWRGVAPRSRGTVWARAIGNELELSDASYHAALARANELEKKLARREGSEEEKRMGGWFAAIRRDVAESTYGELRIFQAGGPLHEGLVDVLMAYTMYRSDVGYVGGTNNIAALLLLNLPTPASTFATLANALNRPLPLSFLTRDLLAISRIHSLTLSTLATKFPTLYSHLCSPAIGLNVYPEHFLDRMFESLFTFSTGLDEATRLWDVWAFEGDAVLVRAAVAVFAQAEGRLYGAVSKMQVLDLLGRVCAADGENGLGAKDREDVWMERVRDAGRAGVARSHGDSSGSSPGSGEP